MVNVGVIGLGLEWETRFVPALRKLRERIAVRAVYDPVAGRALQAAAEWNATAVDGLVALAERTDVRALLLLDAGWSDWQTVRLLCASQKPILVVSGLCGEQSALASLRDEALGFGQTVMPGFHFRYTPATCRLRELLATALGPATGIRVEVTSAQPEAVTTDLHTALGLFDWCAYVVGSSPRRVESSREEGSGTANVTLHFDRRDGDGVAAELKLPALRPSSPGHAAGAENVPDFALRATVECRQGTATLESSTCISWLRDGETVRETLASERTETEVMLDLFCRRVVGGLIPVADMADVVRSARVLHAAEVSRRQDRRVDVESGT